MNPTRAEIDLAKLEHNFGQIKKYLTASNPEKKVKICGVVKANAYGHGIVEISKKLVSIGADFLGVANYDEAIRLRMLLPDIPILVFGTLIHSTLEPENYVNRLLDYNLTATVASLDTARFLDIYNRRLKTRFKIHIKVDTGMRRIGFDYKRALKHILEIASYKHIEIEGIFTHFATSEDRNKRFAKLQLKRFNQLLEDLRKAGVEIPLIHSANSGAVLELPESHFDMVRPGLILYGYYPSEVIKNKIALKPIMNLKSKVTYIKKVDEFTSISYGRSFFTKRKTIIGSVPVGYGDGYLRALSNRSKVYIRNRLFPVVGNITMDWLMVDLGTKDGVRIGDDVLLIGEDGPNRIGAEQIAKLLKTIPYEVCCNVADRVQRVYLNA